MKYSIYLMDADETLFDFPASARHSLKTAFEAHGIPYTKEIQEKYSRFNHQCWDAWERKELTREQLGVRRFELLFDDLGIREDAVKFQVDFMDNMAKCGHLLKGADLLVQRLAKRGRVYIVTNGFTNSQYGRLKVSGLAPYVSGVFISEELGVQKPDVQFFEKAFAGIDGFKKEETLMIGDSLSSDMQGGVNAGLDTCWYNPKGLKNDRNLPITREVTTFRQIYDMATGHSGIDLDGTRQVMEEEGLRCVASDENGVVFSSDKRGIAPMLDLYDRVQKGQIAPTVLCDRVFGRGAVMMAHLCGIKTVYSEVASSRAVDCAKELGICLTAGETVPHIVNRTGDGPCPIESAVQKISDPKEGYLAILNRLKELSAADKQGK